MTKVIGRAAGDGNDQEYEYITKLVRWLAIGTVLLTYPFDAQNAGPVIVLVALAVLYNVSRYLKSLVSRPFFASPLNTLVADTLFAMGLFWLTGGLSSPYYFYLLFMAVTAAHWYGIRGFALTFTSYAIMSLALATQSQLSPPVLNELQILILKLSILCNIGVLILAVTYRERSSRAALASINVAAEAERQRLLALINSLADAVIATDDHGIVTLYNGAALELLNTNTQLVGRQLKKLLPLHSLNQEPVDVIAVTARSKTSLKRDDLMYTSNEGSKMILDISVAPIRSPKGSGLSHQGYIVIVRDITKEKSLEQQRDEFISVASHELRTPLAIAEANISTALLPKFAKIDPKALTLLNQAHQNIIFLGDLIKDLTTLSRAEQGMINLQPEPVDPKTVLEQLVRDHIPQAQKKGLKLKTFLAPGLKPISSSEYMIREVLQNFVTNAIKYTETGSVEIHAEPGDNGGLTFSVKDTGIGISSSDKKHLFTKFYRSEDYRTRKTGGTGLGLYITVQLAERLGGKVWYKSKLNAGSTFYLEVPKVPPVPAGKPLGQVTK